MGMEIFHIFYWTTPVVFLINIGFVFVKSFPNVKALVFLMLNVMFIGYFLLDGYFAGYLIQSYLIGGFFLLPFQMLVLFIVIIFSNKLNSYAANTNDVT